MNKINLIHTVLEKAFHPEQLDIIDESHKHSGHAGAKSGGGHFIIHIVCSSFKGKSRISRHRMVNNAAKSLFENNTIHALSVKAKTPAETR